MGMIMVDKKADYSQISWGQADVYTEVTSGLRLLHDLRRSARRAIYNSAPKGSPARMVGAEPTYAENYIDFATAGQWVSAYRPKSGGLSMAIGLRIKNGGANTDRPVGSLLNPTVNGGAYFIHWNRRIQFELTSSTSPTAVTEVVAHSPFIDAAADGSDDGKYEIFVTTVEYGVGVTLYRPKTGQSAFVATNTTRYFTFLGAAEPYKVLGSGGAQGMFLFAEWDRALSAGEVAQFYADMSDYFALLGLSI